jgi:endoglucanase
MQHRRSRIALLLSCAWLAACASAPKDSSSWTPPDPEDTDAPAGSPVALHGQLKVEGGQLKDQSGLPVQLKGVSSMWLNWDIHGYPSSLDGLTFMRDNWKVSVIRAAMGTEQSGGYLTDPNAMLRKVDNMIRNALKVGVYVLVDWHTEKAVEQQTQAVAFFSDMAQKFGAYPNVIWETYNEPRGYDWSDPNDPTTPTIKKYHEAVVSAIRAVDPDNLIILGTPNWSQKVDEAAADPVAGSNLLYTLHFYSCSHFEWLRALGNKAIASGAALFITEFGATHADGGLSNSDPARDHYYACPDEANLWFDWMAQNNISGIAWKLDACSDASCILTSKAPMDGPWPDDMLSTHIGGEVDGQTVQGGHGLFVVNWLRQ